MKPPLLHASSLPTILLALLFLIWAPSVAVCDDAAEPVAQECSALDKELAAFKERLEQIESTNPEGRERGEKELAAFQEELERIDQKYGDSPAAEDAERKKKEIDALSKLMFQHIDDEERDQTKGKSDICPVHHLKMKARLVPVKPVGDLYNLPGLLEARAEMFPYGWEWYGEAGDIPSGIETAKIYVCPKCVEAWKKWEARLKKRVKEAAEAKAK